jgi:hypothetical protein
MKEITLYKGKEKISFDENRHIFYDDKGNCLLSVTGVTGTIDKSGALMGWVAKMIGLYLLQEKEKGNDKITEQLIDTAKREYRRIKQEAADIGQAIHDWISEWIKGKKPEMPDNEKVVNGITAFLKFQKEHKIKWLESERFVFSKKHKFCGILDAIGKTGKELVLFDFKSSNAIYPEMFLQVAGYNIAYQEETGKKIDKKVIIRFGKEDGMFQLKELENEGKDEKAFLACLELTKRLKELR